MILFCLDQLLPSFRVFGWMTNFDIKNCCNSLQQYLLIRFIFHTPPWRYSTPSVYLSYQGNISIQSFITLFLIQVTFEIFRKTFRKMKNMVVFNSVSKLYHHWNWHFNVLFRYFLSTKLSKELIRLSKMTESMQPINIRITCLFSEWLSDGCPRKSNLSVIITSLDKVVHSHPC